MKNITLAQEQQNMIRAKEIHQNDKKETQKDFSKLIAKNKMKYIKMAENERNK